MLLDALDQAGGAELGHDALARDETVEPAEALRHAVVGERGARGKDHDQRQMVPQRDLVVVEIVSRRDLDAARAEGRIDEGIGDHRDVALGERQAHPPPDEGAVTLVLGMHRHRRIAQQGLRPGGRHHHVTAAAGEGVAQVPQLAVLLLCLHLQVRQRGEQHRVPVDQAFAAVDEPRGVQLHEHLDDGARQLLVHGETIARPVHRIAEAAHLRGDGAAGLGLPGPDALEKGLAPERAARRALRVQLPLHHHLRGNAGVIGTRLPQRRIAQHAVVADERVHQRVLERVPHVQRPGHVRRRDHDAIRRAGGARREPAVRLPALVAAPLNVLRRVHLVHGARNFRSRRGRL